ncbi:hypothetical protein D9615_009611 [Tricholomella constricta]|uniref:Uncharacterized protein n=1 Tax=Tricholomella constricta TaxID=117010 RepID=A0A8H5LVW9_9AGAR|nr:hypothetical protein D9615_009611 [Tricholomella constricta]
MQLQLRFRHSGHTPKDERDKLADLLSNLTSVIRSKKDPVFIDQYIHGRLDRLLRKSTKPDAVYGKVISFLIQRQRLTDATSVYERMLGDDLVPTTQTQAEMAAVALALSDSDVEIQQALDAIASSPKCTEQHFLRLLEILGGLGASHGHLLRVTRVFIETRGEGYTPSRAVVTKLVDVQTRAGQLDDAFATILRSNEHEGEGGPSSEPYAAMMQALKHTDPANSEAFNKILDRMTTRAVAPDIHIFNALISRELRQTSLRTAFDMYRVVIELSLPSSSSGEISTSPTAGTFAPLFALLAKAYHPTVHKRRTPRRGRPDTVIPPRQLFRDMLYFHARTRPPAFPITAPLLTTALRAFLNTHDYIGALLVLNAFRVFHLPPSATTYEIVLRHVVNRVRVGRPVRWVGRFVFGSGGGCASSTPLLKAGTRTVVDRAWVEKLLECTRGSVFSMMGPLFEASDSDGDGGGSAGGERERDRAGEKQKRYTVPKLRMIEGEAPVPVNMEFALVPLQRLVRRAAFASLGVEDGNKDGKAKDGEVEGKDGEGKEGEGEGTRGLYRAVADAKREMIPRREHPYLELSEEVSEVGARERGKGRS